MDPRQWFQSGGLNINYASPTQNLPSGPGFGYYGSQDVYHPTNQGVLGASTSRSYSAPAPAPQTSGQQAAPAGNNNYDAYLSNLRDQYSSARSSIENLNPQLDQSYNLGKGDIQTALDQAQNTANTQKDTLNSQYGDILRNQLKTYQDLGRQRQGIFSNLGTLDSSAFNEQQFRADQDLSNQRNQTDLEKTRSLKSVDDQFGAYQKQAQSSLAQLALQYQSGKNAIADALRNNDVQEAGAIQSALQQISDRANAIQDNMRNWATQAALLKSQGVNVMGALQGISADPYNQQVQQQLGQARAFGQSLIPQAQNLAGQGFIGSNNNQNDLLKQLGLA